MTLTSLLYVLDWNVGSSSDDPEDPFRRGRIAVGSTEGGQLKTLITNERMPDGIDVLVHENTSAGYLVWTQMGDPDKNDGLVQLAKIDGTDTVTLYSDGEIHTPKQVTIDEVGQKLYIGDREGLRIHRCNLDGKNTVKSVVLVAVNEILTLSTGSGKEILIQRGDFRNPSHRHDKDRHCVGVCIDSNAGKFYWTQKGPSKGGEGRIFRANIITPQGLSDQCPM